ncbi:HPr family phosphocarrier protein [Priestia megaterium]|uniref:HPr family phosphocarrier protein n=1 Tax=Priestia megaterium TaxID=1404 RepID=A0A6H1PBJ7_PRIMG|nr:HPr family phosphocarrier protein [Priestia megaterium]
MVQIILRNYHIKIQLENIIESVSGSGESIMGVWCLAIRQGEEITLVAGGIDEQKAISFLEAFLLGENNNF